MAQTNIDDKLTKPNGEILNNLRNGVNCTHKTETGKKKWADAGGHIKLHQRKQQQQNKKRCHPIFDQTTIFAHFSSVPKIV